GVVGVPVGQTRMLGKPRLLLRGIGCGEISKLISESGEGSAKGRRRELVQMDRNNATRALNHELNGEPAYDQQRGTRRKNPEWDQQHPADRRDNDDAPAAPLLREMTD